MEKNQIGPKKKKGLFGCVGCLGIIVIIIAVVLISAAVSDSNNRKGLDNPETLAEHIESDIYEDQGRTTNNEKDKVVGVTADEKTGVVKVVLNGDESLSTKSTKEAMLYDAKDIFPLIFKYDEVNKATVAFKFTLVDTYGKESDEEVIRITLTKEANDKIVWENFNIDNFSFVADNLYVHPAMLK